MGARAARGPSGNGAEELARAPSISGTPQLRGVTMQIMTSAIGLGFRPTASGKQQTSDDQVFNEHIVWHYTIDEANPACVHVSYYPADDSEYKRKIQHCAYRWNSDSETFVREGVVRGTWKPFVAFLTQFQSHSDQLMSSLRESIISQLDTPVQQQPPSLQDRFVYGGTMVPRDDGMGYEPTLQKNTQLERDPDVVP
jgi:hypothetical protein